MSPENGESTPTVRRGVVSAASGGVTATIVGRVVTQREVAIRRLYEAGAHFVLCNANKHPIGKGWNKPGNRPRLNAVVPHIAGNGLIGIIPATVGLIAIDIDRDVEASVSEITESFGPPVAMQRTPSGGAHMFYPAAKGRGGNAVWGVSTEDPSKQRGELRQSYAGQVCVYDAQAIADALPVDGPPFDRTRFLTLFPKPKTSKTAKGPAKPGNRNNALFRKVAGAARKGDRDGIEKAVSEAREAGLPETEIAATVASAERAGAETNAQLDIAGAMAETHGDKLAYGSDLGWHTWTGTHWIREGARDAARRAVIETIHETEMHPLDKAKAKTDGFIGGTVNCANVNDQIYRSPEKWDRQHPTLFNVLNGTLDLEAGKLRAHNPDDLFLGVADVEWTEKTDNAAYKVWLDYIMETIPAKAEREMLQSFLGYCLTGWINDHHFLMIVGGKGAGKSTLINAISGVMGSLAVNFNADILMKRNYQPHKQEWMVFRGKRVGFAAELRKGASMETATVNLLTGDDRITGNYMRQNEVTYARTHKTILFGNHRPNFGDTTGDGITRRLALLEVTSIPEEKQDPLLTGKLADPKVRSCILHWMVAGLRFFIQDGRKLILPDSVKARNEQAFQDDDPLSDFLDELNVIEDPNGFIPSADLHQLFKDHCEKTGCKQMSQTSLADKLHKRGWPRPNPKWHDGKTRRGFVGRCLG